MRWWVPKAEEPSLLAWWEPLLATAVRARRERVFWPIHIEQFDLLGRVDRGPRPAVWVYRHHESRGLLNVDGDGVTYRYIPRRSEPGRGQFRAVEVWRAIYGAGLPDVVEPIWYEPPRPAQVEDDDDDWDEAQEDDAFDGDPSVLQHHHHHRRRHLWLVEPAGGGDRETA